MRGEASSSRLSPEPVLIDFQRPNLRFQRGPRDAQLGRSPRGSKYPTATFFQGGLDHVLLLHEESPRSSTFFFDSGVRGGGCRNQFSSIEKISVSPSIPQPSITFFISRKFSRQG